MLHKKHKKLKLLSKILSLLTATAAATASFLVLTKNDAISDKGENPVLTGKKQPQNLALNTQTALQMSFIDLEKKHIMTLQ